MRGSSSFFPLSLRVLPCVSWAWCYRTIYQVHHDDGPTIRHGTFFFSFSLSPTLGDGDMDGEDG